jgi:alpha-1,2-mannosyltransferase
VQIAIYNGRTSDADHGPMVFGVEPWHFYPVNLFLNFNIAAILAFTAPFIIVITRILSLGANSSNTAAGSLLYEWCRYTSPLWIWVALFTKMAHKEERFLFVVYPLICLSSAIALSSLHSAVISLTRRVSSSMPVLLMGSILVPYVLISISRTCALVIYYGAPLYVYQHMHNVALHNIASNAAHTNDIGIGHGMQFNDTSVCVGKEWYRFPSHFFIPSPYHLEFIKSDFTGLLPAHFEADVDGVLASSIIPSAPMNDRNHEEPSRYIDIDQCAYIIDLNLDKPHQYEPYYGNHVSHDDNDNSNNNGKGGSGYEWKSIGDWPFLDASASNRLARAFYVPWFTSSKLTFRQYQLLKRTTPLSPLS